MSSPLILYVPGLMPKPEAGPHRDALYRSMLHGLEHTDAEVAAQIDAAAQAFDIVSWTWDFYGEHRDIGRDTAAIDDVIERQAASLDDMREASSWARRLTLWLYRLGDRLPFLIPHLASERMELHLRDLHRYLDNQDDAGGKARDLLKLRLRAAEGAGRPVLLLTHSMGSVIAYDALWELSREDGDAVDVSLWMTMGSPLGQRYLQQRLLGSDRSGPERYPSGIRRWVNLTAVGDLTAIDPGLADDFAPMAEQGLVESITDLSLYNHFRLDGQLNVHAEFGYLANAVTGKVVGDWWVDVTGGG